MEVADIAVKPVKEFAKDSYRLVRKCTKPDRKEFTKIALRTGLGFVVMGFVGFFVKLILCVPPVDRIRRSIDRSFPLSARFSDPPPRTSRSPRNPPRPAQHSHQQHHPRRVIGGTIGRESATTIA